MTNYRERCQAFVRRGIAIALWGAWCSAGFAQATAPRDEGVAGEVSAPAFDAAEWADLAAAFAVRPDVTADFTESRYFPFKERPAVMRGEVRVSRERGLSLRYTSPDDHVVIVDREGVVLRDKKRSATPPADVRGAVINRALMNTLNLNFAALAEDFRLEGERKGEAWTLILWPREKMVQQAFRQITVSGRGTEVERIELRRSQRQFIEIMMNRSRESVGFTAEEIGKYFR
jgi:outer membrane lipoprotein-sorting protein